MTNLYCVHGLFKIICIGTVQFEERCQGKKSVSNSHGLHVDQQLAVHILNGFNI